MYLSQIQNYLRNGQWSYTHIMQTLVNRHRRWIQKPRALLLIVVAFLVNVKQRRAPKMRPHYVQQPSRSTLPRLLKVYQMRIHPYSGPAVVVLKFNILTIVVPCRLNCYWKNHQNEAEYVLFFIFKKFLIGLKKTSEKRTISLHKGQLACPQCVICSSVLLYIARVFIQRWLLSKIWMILSMLVSHPKVGVLCNPF